MRRTKQLVRTSGVTRTARKRKVPQVTSPSGTARKAVSR
jgi:hypothetical protein